ncbi:MAG: ABC transporter permease subunit [Mesorhizobium sp.]|nr:MAG: ABC transporter permease subunit [Mesorhizobium sp.]RWB64894.1 MAG: ABC transporter permease subunit [Mesorhizobium sp.]RWB88146.1 MAG: ABC transporter permease subunit [Mesorhizobium sp.]RWC16709.1 MAG: ABC transporter permease subunit [Mesorhizobium sp.]RWD77318.1 MAG: ABC transporter permease subunit [Mesorhizobium sp.]
MSRSASVMTGPLTPLRSVELPSRPRVVSPTGLLARALLAVGLSLCVAPLFGLGLPAALSTVPDALVPPFMKWSGTAITYVAKDAAIFGVELNQLTRAFATIFLYPMRFLQDLLTMGITVGGVVLPPLPWLSVVLAAALFGARLGGWKLAVLVASALLYALLFGLWQPTMLTLASVLVSVLVGTVTGTLLGITVYRHPALEKVMTPVYDIMQTVPVFAYLVPILYLFGFGPVGAMIATVIYATPPMARVVTLALEEVPPSIREAAEMAGTTRRQSMWLVLLPSCRQKLLVGLNQLIMLSLATVIIASVIGADGLGAVVLKALQSLKIGKGIEAGAAIVLLAIALDQLGKAAASPAPAARVPGWLGRGSFLSILLATLTVPFLLQLAMPWLGRLPMGSTLSMASWWDNLVLTVNANWSVQLRETKTLAFIWLLKPAKLFALSIPWFGAVIAVAAAGYILQGWRLAVTCLLMMLFVATSGLWMQAQLTSYLLVASVIPALLIGIPVGILCVAYPKFDAVMTWIIDTIQTLPSFVYLIPIIMFLGSGDFAALIAIVAYAWTPAARYTAAALRNIPGAVIEVAEMTGASAWQRLFFVRLPVARSGLLLAVNQTIMMAFGVLVITALIGTKGLEADCLMSLSKADPGRGIVAGAAMVCLAIMADRLLRASLIKKART